MVAVVMNSMNLVKNSCQVSWVTAGYCMDSDSSERQL